MLTVYKKGEVCKFEEKDVLILAINNVLGYNRYTIINLDSGQQYCVSKHQLSKLNEMYVDEPDNDMDHKQEQPAMDNIPDPQPKQVAMDINPDPQQPESIGEKQGRFVKKTEQEINEIETHTKARTTHQQTKWGVKILKGIYILIFNMYCTKKHY